VIRKLICAVAVCLLGLSVMHGQTQQPAPVAVPPANVPDPTKPGKTSPGVDSIAQSREAVRKTEAEHPGNTVALVEALGHLVGAQIEAGLVDQSTFADVTREIQVAEAASGAESKPYVGALGDEIEVLVRLSRAAEARPVAERALAIAQRDFPGTDDAATIGDELGLACSRLGDFPCALQAYEQALEIRRKIGGNANPDLIFSLNHLGQLKSRMGDINGAIQADEEALALSYHLNPNDNRIPINENNLGSRYIVAQKFDKASAHLSRALAEANRLYSPGSTIVMEVNHNLASLYTRTGKFPEAWKAFQFSLSNVHEQIDYQAVIHAHFAQSLAQGGNPQSAIEEALTSARMSRELFVLEARTLPERQALAYDATRPRGLDTSISVVLKHPELPVAGIYQEAVRSRALVADEMARRQRNLNASNDAETGRLLADLDHARSDLLAAEHSASSTGTTADRVQAANSKMEAIERSLAEHSAAMRADERIDQVTTEDVRHNLPPQSVLVSYFQYRRSVVDAVDPAASETLSYMAFVVHPESDQIRIFNLGDSASLDALVLKARAAAESESQSGGLGSIRNERAYREAGLAIRQRIWDPLNKEIGTAKLVLVVGDGNLNLISFASLPDGNGYLVEHAPVIHTLSSERDLVPTVQGQRKQGLLAIGSPSFELAENRLPPSPLRGATPTCEEFSKLEFQPLPGTAVEVSDLGSAWHRWNSAEPAHLVTGDDATLATFLTGAAQNRVLHVATHAFLLDKSCAGGNPLLHSGLVFAGGSHGATQSILTAQQIASLDLTGVDWAVLSACNTGNGELRDGEGVLGLQRAFRVAGAHSVIMTLWPVDDDAARQFMHELYAERLGAHATTADAVWNSSRKLLLERRAAGKSTHPWYWAGFVGSGGWE